MKAIPQMCPTAAETSFKKIVTGFRQNLFVLFFLSIVHAEVIKKTLHVLRSLIIHSLKILFFPSDRSRLSHPSFILRRAVALEWCNHTWSKGRDFVVLVICRLTCCYC